MPRIKIDLPEDFSFITEIPIRITDLNYGGHVGNDNVLSIIHEARVQFLRSIGHDELDLGGVGLIMSDVAIEFKSELFYGDTIVASVAAGEISKIGFVLFYKLDKKTEGKNVSVIVARTAMVCFNYATKKIASLPESVRNKLEKK